jgi:ATP synthase, F0 subunit b
MSLLTPDIGLLFWMTISFGIVFFVLAKFGFPTIIKAAEKRNEYINNSLDAAEEAEQKLATINEQAEVIINKAQEERTRLLNEAGELRNRILSEAKEKADKDIRARINKASTEIEELKRKALGDIKSEIANISIRIAEKVVQEEMKSGNKQQELIKHLLEEDIIYKN